MTAKLTVFVLLLVCVMLAAPRPATAIRWHQLSVDYTYDHFCREFQRVPEPGRRSLFEAELHRVLQHNAGGFSWKEGINAMSDRTPGEKRALLGAVKELVYADVAERTAAGTFWRSETAAAPDPVAEHVDWRQVPGVLSAVKDQGKCGSCWTFGTAEAVESYFSLGHQGALPVLSEQQLLDCTPNPQSCGGTGGCGGSTATLALDQIISMGGLASEWTYPYQAYYGNVSATCGFNPQTTPPVAVVSGYDVLPSNEAAPLVQKLQNGPVIVNVDASTWHAYETGVYNGCNQTSPVINHIVLAVGYTPTSWIVRNSWGPLWGQQGYIELARDPASQPCGFDTNPQAGIGCQGGPNPVKVCGTCGITFSCVVPTVV